MSRPDGYVFGGMGCRLWVAWACLLVFKRLHREIGVRDHHHSVYVILLDSAVALHPSVRRLNPARDPAKRCLYVGMTGLPVAHRFENHKHGYKSAWTVRKYGIRLLPELYQHLNPMPYQAAAQMEKDLTEDLRAQGYTVTGGT